MVCRVEARKSKLLCLSADDTACCTVSNYYSQKPEMKPPRPHPTPEKPRCYKLFISAVCSCSTKTGPIKASLWLKCMKEAWQLNLMESVLKHRTTHTHTVRPPSVSSHSSEHLWMANLGKQSKKATTNTLSYFTVVDRTCSLLLLLVAQWSRPSI